MGKTLVVYYSRSGNTKKVAELLKEQLKCDVEEIMDLKNRKGLFGFISGGRDAMKRKHTQIEPVKNDLGEYKMVILATPVWASTTSPAIRTYAANNINKIRNFAFIVTGGGLTDQDMLDKMSAEFGSPIATAAISKNDFKNGNMQKIVTGFVNEIK
jgi:multimeric flavodoxin WrbA